jgi:hypothetical protein
LIERTTRFDAGRGDDRGLLDAYAKGEVELPPVPDAFRNAQKFDLPGGKSYSLAAVARFLGWVTPSDGQATHACRAAFDACGRRAALRSTR